MANQIQTLPFHIAYLENIYMWQTARDTLAGEATIKSRKTRYLPMPAAMTINPDFSPVNHGDENFGLTPSYLTAAQELMVRQYNPNYHRNLAYRAYLTRAQFPELPAFILRGLMGLTSNDEPTVSLPSSMEYLLTEATTTGLSLREYYMHILSETLSVGRASSVIEINPEVFATYSSESLINWKTERYQNSAKKQPTMVIVTELVDKKSSHIGVELESVYKILVLDENTGVYYIKEVEEKNISLDKPITELIGDTTIPEYKGKPFDHIPIQMFGPVSNSFEVQNSPIAAVASTALQIYMKYADLSNSEFMSCSPTLIISGVSEDFAPKAVGSTVALILPDEMSKAYYTSTDTSALTHVLRHITDLYEQAIYAGAQLLDSSKKAAESAETTRLKQAASGATLSSVVRNVATGVQNQLREVAVLLGENPKEVVFSAITDFSAPAITAQEQQALVASWTEGAISHMTLMENFRRAGILQDGETPEDEVKRIQEDEIKPTSVQQAEMQAKLQADVAKATQLQSDKEKKDVIPPTEKETTPKTDETE